MVLSSDWTAPGWSSLSNWRPRAAGPNDTRQYEHEDARARSRELIRSDPIAAGAISTNVAHAVGTGLTMKPAINAKALGMTANAARAWQDATALRFEMWASSKFADAGVRLDFYDMQALALRSTLASGDVFALMTDVDERDWPFRLAVQLIESDRVCNPNREQDRPGGLVSGIQLDPRGRAIACHVCNRHPSGGYGDDLTWRRIPMVGARTGRVNLLHLYDVMRPDQVRGTPYLNGVIGKLKDLSRYSEAELAAAVTSAALTVFTRMSPEGFELFDPEGQANIVARGMAWDGTVRPNSAINLLPGEEIDIPKSERPNANFDPFFLAVVRQIGVGLELPFEVLIKHFTASYSASRAAMLDAWRTFRRRRDWIAKGFCQPIYQEWLSDEVANGNISAPGFFSDPLIRWAYSAAQWIGDGPGSIDPLKEINAATARINAGVSTLEAESILHDGVGWETKHAQRVVESEARRAAGLEMDPAEQLLASKSQPADEGN